MTDNVENVIRLSNDLLDLWDPEVEAFPAKDANDIAEIMYRLQEVIDSLNASFDSDYPEDLLDDSNEVLSDDH